tara:strand:- start:147 stop:470 length:324 start_codon:yes stop_codon:yes gene_type:complete
MRSVLSLVLLFSCSAAYTKDFQVGDEVKVNSKSILCRGISNRKDIASFQSARDKSAVEGYLNTNRCVESVQRVEATVIALGSTMGLPQFVQVSAEGFNYWVSNDDIK